MGTKKKQNTENKHNSIQTFHASNSITNLLNSTKKVSSKENKINKGKKIQSKVFLHSMPMTFPF